MEFKTVLGKYINNTIITETEIIPARAYSSKHAGLVNRYGYWLLKMNPGWTFWVITEYIE